MSPLGRRLSPRRHAYGPDPSQFADLYEPAEPRRPGVVVALLHGGFWGPHHGLDYLEPVVADLTGRGWTVWNIEYRRLDLGGGYPTTLEDVASAVDLLATLDDVDAGRVVAVGHSAGGHLATWAAGRAKLPAGAPGAGPAVAVDAVISLAGVVDLATAARENDGNGAATRLVGGRPEQYPERYAVADPIAQVPLAVPVRLVHARGDDRVPFARSQAYEAAARSAGQDVALIELPGDHFTVADSADPSWPMIIETLEELSDGRVA